MSKAQSVEISKVLESMVVGKALLPGSEVYLCTTNLGKHALALHAAEPEMEADDKVVKTMAAAYVEVKDSVSPQEDGAAPMGSTADGGAGLGCKDIRCQTEKHDSHTLRLLHKCADLE
eukprot:6462784-Amphidinium_carterae.4